MFDRSEYNKKYYSLNKEKVDAKNKTWRLSNLVESNKHSLDWKSNHLESVLFRSAKSRSKKKNLEFSIELKDIIIPDFCPILKQPFVTNSRFAATLDRINPSLGYTKDNVWVISKKANMMKNDATIGELTLFAQWVLNDSKT